MGIDTVINLSAASLRLVVRQLPEPRRFHDRGAQKAGACTAWTSNDDAPPGLL